MTANENEIAAAEDGTAEDGTAEDAATTGLRRASLGRVLVALAVFAPVLLILGVFLVGQESFVGSHVREPKWPWIFADVALLLLGMRMMRGEDL